MGANKTIRFLAWLGVAESLYLKKPLTDKALHIIYKKKHLNSDWIHLLEETGASFAKGKLRNLASKLLQLRNYEAHTEKDPSSIPQSIVELALDTFKAFILEVEKLLSTGELV